MSFKKRLKAAIVAFNNPKLIENKTAIKADLPISVTPQPKVIIDNQLLVDKNVLITGAGRNIGKAIAKAMAAHGANIYFTDINSRFVAELEADLKQEGVKYKGFIADINNFQDTDEICNYLSAENINVDILVNNVGIQFNNIGIKNDTHAQRVKTLNTNVLSPMYLTQKIVEQMIENKNQGSIIFITSMHQFTPLRIPIYSASKAALGAIVKELAVDLSGHKIRVNGLAPGWTIEDEIGNSLHHPYTILHQSSIQPCYIARAAVYLAAEYFSYFTTGITLTIDAGLSLYNHRLLEHPPTNYNPPF